MIGITPPPPSARFHGSLPKLGAPVHVAEYADGFKICAYYEPADPTIGRDAGRRYLAWQWGADVQDYVQRALPEQPRPLYRADNLERHPDWPVYVFEREDMVDAFHTLSGDAPVIATTCPGGASAFVLGEWGALIGRTVTLWPTHSPDCELAMHELARQLDKQGTSVSIVALPQTLSPGWNLLSAIQSAWTWEQVEDFVAHNLATLERQVQPIRQVTLTSAPLEPLPIRANGATEPAQSETQIRTYRDTWARIKGLQTASTGVPYAHMANVCAVLESFKGRYADVWWDEFYGRVMHDEQKPRAWSDTDTLQFTHTLQRELGFPGIRPAVVWDAIQHAAHQRPRHEVREWLQSLKWDEEWRLGLMLPIGFGAEAAPYSSAVGRCWLVSAVARVMRPGCQVDYVPVFEGAGGIGKTQALRILGGEWFDNPSAAMGEKDFLQNMHGKWILELAELANIRRAQLEIVKALITRTRDTYRAPYARTPCDHPRQCVFAGTIDRTGWNTDDAGGRRFWPVQCGRIDGAWLTENREQLFAEAYARFTQGDVWHDVPEGEAKIRQRAAQPEDVWTELVSQYVTGLAEVKLGNVLEQALHLAPRDWTAYTQDRARGILKSLKWTFDARAQLWRKT